MRRSSSTAGGASSRPDLCAAPPLRRDTTTVQATGASAADLLAVAGRPVFRERLTTAAGTPVALRRTTYGVTGRCRLMRDGQIVAPSYPRPFFARHPRTVAGRMAGGAVMLVTIDGCSTRSTGATLVEAVRVARPLGMVDAANLDGGGSTAMAVRGRLVSVPADGRERAVGDAVALLTRPPSQAALLLAGNGIFAGRAIVQVCSRRRRS